MTILRNVVFVAALAGLVAAIVLTAQQILSTVPLIVQAESYEQADATGLGHAASDAAVGAHEHDPEAWQPADGFERYFFTALANLVTAIGFALILVVASEFAGGIGGWRQGLLWGLAGFAIFTVAPSLGLPPELPAMPAAELGGRQVWWWGTVAATAAGLALIAFHRSLPMVALALALIVAPHVIGAPQPVDHETLIPKGLHHQFVVAVTAANLVFWAVLGVVAGALRPRFLAGSESLGQ